jgi:hypothetical protein
MILQAHSSYLHVYSQTILCSPARNEKMDWYLLFLYCSSRELDENDVHIGTLCHAPDSPLHSPLAHNSNTWMGSNCLSIRESWGVVGICVSTWQNIMVQGWVCVWYWFTLSSPTITDITSPFGAWWATHGESGWSPELIWLTIRLVWALSEAQVACFKFCFPQVAIAVLNWTSGAGMQNCPSAKSVAGILAAGRDTKEIRYLCHFHV